jgi:hypothetical protein
MLRTARLLLALAAATSCGCFLPPPFEERAAPAKGRTTARLNLRIGPSLQSPVLTVIEKGDELPLLEQLPGWYRTQFRGTDGFVRDGYVRLVKEHVRLRPADEAILERAGWLDYVVNHIDVLRYHDCWAFVIDGGYAAAYCRVDNAVRLAEVATSGHSDLAIAQHLVHEAAHLEFWTRTGRIGPESYAEAQAEAFLRDYENRSLASRSPGREPPAAEKSPARSADEGVRLRISIEFR